MYAIECDPFPEKIDNNFLFTYDFVYFLYIMIESRGITSEPMLTDFLFVLCMITKCVLFYDILITN